jgi:glyoxylase-like metal-dependent hydrolase (beta-lactamase superfamily II)
MNAVAPIAAGVSWLVGYMPPDPWREPDVANAFVVERGGDLCLIDTGCGATFRAALAAHFAGRRYGSVTLINTHLHPDHVANNDLLGTVAAEQRRHLIHPVGVPYVDTFEWAKSEARAAAQAYSPFRFDTFPLTVLGHVGRLLQRVKPEAAYGFYARVALRKFQPLRSRTQFLSPLPQDRLPLRIGEQEFAGWRDGPLVLLDDRGHSPDSLAVYDPEARLLLLGDLTYEDNPLWPSGTYDRALTNLRAYRAVVEAGLVQILGDGHHHRVLFGQQEILPLLNSLIDTQERRRAAILQTADRLRTVDVETVRRALVAKNAEFGQLAREREYPRAICFTRAMIAVALRERAEAARTTPSPYRRALSRGRC